jgi:predicted nuclease with TOPRIM domain
LKTGDEVMEEAVKERPMPADEVPTFEQLRAMFRDIAESQKETDKKFQETDRLFKEMREESKETDKQFQEMKGLFKETERIVKRNSRQMGQLSNKFGKLAEHLVAPGIVKRFRERELYFKLVTKKGGEITDIDGKTLTQIDILLENEELIVAVEVKAKPVEKDIGHHKRRLEILRESMNMLKQNHRKIQGAIAGAIFDDKVKEATRDAGFYVIEQSGDTMRIDVPEGWVPLDF